MAGGGDLSALLVDLSGMQFGGALLAALGIPQRDKIECFVADFGLRQGELWTRALLLDTTSNITSGTGTINLRMECTELPDQDRMPLGCPLFRAGTGPNMRRNVVKAASAWDITTIRRTGRLLTPSMPVSSSAFPARPPQPSWRISRGCRGSACRVGRVVLVIICILPQRSQVDPQEPRRERGERLVEGLAPVGSGSLP